MHTPVSSLFAAACLAALVWPAGEAAAQADPAPNDAAVASVQGPAQPNGLSPPTPEDAPRKREGFLDKFYDDEDGKLDFSEFLARGGFIPVPIIISEPAVDGGFGLAAMFLKADPNDPRNVTRRGAAALKTGNGSYGFGFFQAGEALDRRLTYRFGVGRGKVNLTAFPRFAPGGIEYSNSYKYGVIGTARWHVAGDRLSIGPIIDFRKFDSQLVLAGAPPEYAADFGRTLKTGAIGLGVHYDSRDNRLSPTSGLDAFVDAKFNLDELGSDREFETYEFHAYAFHRLSPQWRLAAKAELDTIRGRYPSVFAPYVEQRGIEAVHYQGENVLSTEAELTWQVSRRWSLLAFAGYGTADGGDSRIFADSGAIVSGGAGFRYLIARKLGLQVGIDAAVGPQGEVVYLQFGHAWALGMD